MTKKNSIPFFLKLVNQRSQHVLGRFIAHTVHKAQCLFVILKSGHQLVAHVLQVHLELKAI